MRPTTACCSSNTRGSLHLVAGKGGRCEQPVTQIQGLDGIPAITARHVAGQVGGRGAFQQQLIRRGIGIIHAGRRRVRADAQGKRGKAVIFDIGLLDMARRFRAGLAAGAIIHIEIIGPVAEQLALQAQLGAAEIRRRWTGRVRWRWAGCAPPCALHVVAGIILDGRAQRRAEAAIGGRLADSRPLVMLAWRPAPGSARRCAVFLSAATWRFYIVELLILLLQAGFHDRRRRWLAVAGAATGCGAGAGCVLFLFSVRVRSPISFFCASICFCCASSVFCIWSSRRRTRFCPAPGRGAANASQRLATPAQAGKAK